MLENLRGKMLSPDSAGKSLTLSRSQIHRLISSGELVAVKLGPRTTRIPGDSLVDYLERKALATERKPVGKHLQKADSPFLEASVSRGLEADRPFPKRITDQ